jgi:glutamine cyclotransferase
MDPRLFALPLRTLLVATLALLLGACESQTERLRVEVVAVHPHDANAFTQGLLYHQGYLYESTGLYGRSDLRQVALSSGEVIRSRRLDARLFGEGLARVNERLIQITYREQVAIAYDLDTFEEVARYTYDGEGWGLCFDGTQLWMSDGSASLQRRDPNTFELLGRVAVQRDGRALARINELECANGHIYANVWLTNEVVRIDPASGRVTAVMDASALVPSDARVRNNRDAVLNGIAHDPSSGRWWLTGKLWPVLYEVRFVPDR